MNMNMKNEKTMLALVLVAALAMVSVAGVALASESSDADDVDVSKLTIVYGDLKITSSTTDSYGVYAETGKTSAVTINADANYTGTLCFGTYDTDAKIFTPLVTLSLTGVSNAIINYDAESDVISISVNEKGTNLTGIVSGDIVISQGTITLGDATDGYFTGKITGNTATIEAVNVIGFFVKADVTDIIGGTVSQGTMKMVDTAVTTSVVYTDAPAKINLTGKANLAFGPSNTEALIIEEDVTFTIATDSTVTGGANADIMTYTGAIKFKIGNTSGSSSVEMDAALYDSDGNMVVSHGLLANGVFTFNNTSKTIYIGEKYTIEIVYTDGTKLYVYSGVVTFSAKANVDTTGTTYDVLMNFGSSASFSKLATTDLTYVDAKAITYDASVYKCLGAYAEGTSQVGDYVGDYWTKSGKITFTSNLTSGDKVVVLLQSKIDGRYFVYNGTLTTNEEVISFGDNNGAVVFRAAAAAGEGYIVTGGKINTEGTATLDYVKQISKIKTVSSGIIVVDGTLDLKYTSNYSYASIDNDGTITVDGHIYYEFNDLITVGGTINAAYYTATSTTTPTNKNTYTTIAKALTESDDIIIVGTHEILEDLELVSTLDGSTTTEVTFDAGSKVNVGSNVATALATSIVSVPTNTTIYVNGTVNVLNGQFRVAELENDVYNGIKAAVFYVINEYGIYTDLATALGLATTAGETVTLRDDASLSTNATLAAGVILDAADNNITIKAGTTFTVNGILKAADIYIEGAYGTGATAKTAGVLVLNNYDKDMTITSIKIGVNVDSTSTSTYGGIVTFGSAFDVGTTGKVNTNVEVVLSNEANPAIVNINGKVTYDGTVSGERYITFNVAGTAVFTHKADVHDLVGTTNVTGTLTAKNVVFATTYLNVTGSGIVSAEDNGAVFVVKKFVSGTPALDITKTTNDTKAVVVLSNDPGYVATAIIYGSYDTSDIMVYNATGTSEGLYTTVFYVNKDVVYKTQIGYTEASLDLTSPVFTAYNFLGWYDSAVNGNKIMTGGSSTVDVYAEVFGYTQIKTTSVTLSMLPNGTYIINGVNFGTSGVVEIPYAESYIMSVLANNGYELSEDFQILVNGKAMPTNYTPADGDVISFSGSINEKATPEKGIDLVTILLIIITIVIVIMAIIIALKLMRS